MLIEVTSLQTDVNVNEDGETQSVTRARYVIKNLSGQFLSLKIPKQASYVHTRLVGYVGGKETTSEIRAQMDTDKGVLLIPIRRQRDPNQPISLEVEYGLPHEKVGWAGTFEISAPEALSHSTFAKWQLRVFDKWAILPAEGSTYASQGTVAPLYALVSAVKQNM
ncbi:MAG: hypothetical protein GY809_09135, partial [Planctomycetes bacterium]|nr:hypothetical protein [Planctomycetota bacterium]